MKRTLLTGMLFMAVIFSSAAQNYKLKTVFVFSFSNYVQWPETYRNGNFNIKVLGDSPILGELQELAKMKKVGARSITVSKISNVNEMDVCHILIVPTSMSGNIESILQHVKGTSTLIVTESPGLGAQGSDINFIDKEEGKLFFEINQAAINQRSLKVSRELVRLAIMI